MNTLGNRLPTPPSTSRSPRRATPPYPKPARSSPYPTFDRKFSSPVLTGPSAPAAVNLCTLPPEMCQTFEPLPCPDDCGLGVIAAAPCDIAGPSSLCFEQCLVVECDNPIRSDCVGACDTTCNTMDWLTCDGLACNEVQSDACRHCEYSQLEYSPFTTDTISSLSAFGTSPPTSPANQLMDPFPNYTQQPSLASNFQNGPQLSFGRPAPSQFQHGQEGRGLPQPSVCLWGACRDSFNTHAELVAHVNAAHLEIPYPPVRTAQRTFEQNNMLACHWADCSQPMLGLQEGSSDMDFSALYALANHLLHDHLGLPVTATADALCTAHSSNNSASISYSSAGPSTFSHSHSTTIPSDMDVFSSARSVFSGDMSTAHSFSTNNSHRPTSLSSDFAHLLPPSIAAPSSHHFEAKVPLDHTPPFPQASQLATPNEASTSSAFAPPPQTSGQCLWTGCGKMFDDLEALSSHIIAEHVGSGKSEYHCGWVGCDRHGARSFASKQKILRHLQSHTGHRPYECTLCGQHFSEMATLQQHMRRHTSEKPYVCDYPGCDKSFAVAGALTIHKRTHSGDKPFKCPHCDRAFAESSNLSKHLRTHTGVKPYPCPEPGCGKKFSRPDQLNRHRAIHTRKKDAVSQQADTDVLSVSSSSAVIEEPEDTETSEMHA